jgi:flavorubredoxin
MQLVPVHDGLRARLRTLKNGDELDLGGRSLSFTTVGLYSC